MTEGQEWIDVSVPLHSQMVTWPGDPAVKIERLLDGTRGDATTLSRIEAGLHAGTHVDAPLHFIVGGAGIEQMPTEAMTGPARVLAVDAGNRIEACHLEKESIAVGERILLKTRNSLLWSRRKFVEEFVHLSIEAAEYLAERRVLTVGIDYLSVAGYGQNEAEVHRMLLGAGTWIIEGLDLSDVVPGDYRLFCLPLAIAGAEAAPARVFLEPVRPLSAWF